MKIRFNACFGNPAEWCRIGLGHKPVRSFIIPCLVWLSAVNALGHESLYRTAEIRVIDPGRVEVCFSVHAPELMMDPTLDMNAVGDEWLASLKDTEIAVLIERSRALVLERFRVELENEVSVTLKGVAFESAALIRNPNREGGARPGCLFASLVISVPQSGMTLHYQRDAEKRLLLAVVRAGAFPKVHDLAPGDSQKIILTPSK